MAGTDLLITLGMDSSSYTQNVKRAKDVTKELDSNLKLASSSVDKFESTIEGLSKVHQILADKIKVATKESDAHSKRIKESSEQIKIHKELSEQLTKEFTKQKQKLDELKKGDPGFKEQKKHVEGLQQQIDKANKNLNNHIRNLIKAKQGYNESQTAIQKFNREIVETQSAIDSLTFDKAVGDIKKEISELDHNFEKAKITTKDFDNSLEGLGTTKSYLNSKINQTSKLLNLYGQEIKSSSNAISELEDKQKSIAQELEKYEKILSELDETDEMFSETSKKVEELRASYSAVSKELETHKQKVETLGKEYRSTEKELLTLEKSLKSTSGKITELKTKMEFDNADKEIAKVGESIKKLKHNFEITKSTVKDFDRSMEGLDLTQKQLKQETALTNKMMALQSQEMKKAENNIDLYTRRIDTVEKELVQWREELSKIDKSSPDYEKMASKIRTLENILAGYNVNLDLNKKRLQDLKTAHASSEKEVAKLSKAFEENSSKIKKMNESVNFTKFESEVNKLTNVTLAKLEKNISSLDDEFDILEKSIKGYDTTVSGLNKKSETQSKILNQLKSAYQEYTKEVTSSKKIVEDLTKKQGELEEKIKSQQKILQNSTGKEWDKQKASLDKLNDEYVKVNENLNKHKQHLKNMESGYSSTGKRVASLNSDLKETKQRLSEIGKEENFNHLESSIESLDNKFKLLDSKFEVYKSSVKNFGSSLKDLGRSKQELADKIGVLKSKLHLFSTSVNETERELNKLKLKQKEVVNTLDQLRSKLAQSEKDSPTYNKTLKAIIELEKEFQNLDKQIDSNTKKFNDLQREMNETTTEINNLTKEQKNLNKEFVNTKLDKFGNISNKIKDVGQALMPVTAGVAALGVGIVKTGSDFQDAMAEVGAITRANSDDFAKMKAKCQELGKTTVFTSTEAAQGLKYLALAGYGVENSISSVDKILQLSQASGMDLSRASDLATDSLASLGYTGEKAVRALPDYLDKAAYTANLANTSIEQLMESFVKTGGQIDNLNIGIDEACAMIGLLANRGIKAEEAGNSLNSILINMTKSSGESAKAMEELGLSFFDSKGNIKDVETVMLELGQALLKLDNDGKRVQLINMLGGKTQAKTIQKLLQGMVDETGNLSKEYSELKENIEKAPDMKALEAMSNTMTNTLSGDFKLLKSAVSGLFETMFDELEPQLRETVQKVTEFVNKITRKFQELSPEMQMFVFKVAGALAILPPLLVGIGTVGKGFVTMGKGIQGVCRFFGLFQSTASATSGVTSLLSKSFSLFGLTVTGSGLAITTAIAAFVGITAAIGENENALSWLQEKWGTFGEVVGGVCEFIAGAVQMTFGNALNFLKGVGGTIGKIFTGKFHEIDDVWSETWANMKATTKKASSNLTAESTLAISMLREVTTKEVAVMNKVLEESYSTLIKTNKDNLGTSANEIKGYISNLSNDTVTMLKGTSKTMEILFNGINTNMDSTAMTEKLKSNLETLLKSGKISAEQLQKDFSKAAELMSKNVSDGFTRTKNQAELVIGELEKVTTKGVDGVSQSISGLIKNMDQGTVNSLKSLGGEWSKVFDGLENTANLSTEEITRIVTENLDKLGVNTPEGLTKLSEILKQELDKIGVASQESSNKSVEAMRKQIEQDTKATQEIMKALQETTTKNVNDLHTKITEGIKTMSSETAQNLAEGSQAWGSILQGAFDKGGNLSEGFAKVIKENIGKINLSTPEQINEFATLLQIGLMEANLNATTEASNLKTNVINETEQMVTGTVGIGEEISKNITPQNMNEDVINALKNAQVGISSQKGPVSEEAKGVGKEAKDKFKGELENMESINLPDGVINGDKVTSEMNKAGNLAVDSFTTSWESGAGKITSTTNTTFESTAAAAEKAFSKIGTSSQSATKNLSSLNEMANKCKSSLSNVQKTNFNSVSSGASSLRKTLTEINTAAIRVTTSLKSVANVKVNSLINGLKNSTTHLGNISTKAKVAQSNLISVSKVSFSSNHKGLDTTIKKLDNITRAAQKVKSALTAFINLSLSRLANNLDNIRNKLTNISSTASSTRSALASINSVGLGGIISQLGSLNRAINSVRNNASSARVSIASLNSARPSSLFSIDVPTYSGDMDNISNMIENTSARFGEVDLANYKTSGGYYSPRSMNNNAVTITKEDNNEEIIKGLLQQNQLLMQLLSRNNDINVNLDVDGRTIAKTTARYMNTEIENFNKRKSRLGGRF